MICCLSSCMYIDNDKSKDLKRNQYEVFGKIYETMSSAEGYLEIGIASWYGKKFQGNLTASGEIYDMGLMTAAHRALPLPTFVKTTRKPWILTSSQENAAAPLRVAALVTQPRDSGLDLKVLFTFGLGAWIPMDLPAQPGQTEPNTFKDP